MTIIEITKEEKSKMLEFLLSSLDDAAENFLQEVIELEECTEAWNEKIEICKNLAESLIDESKTIMSIYC